LILEERLVAEKKVILIVGNDKRLREDISYEIDNENYRILPARKGNEALNCIDSEHIDILIVAIMSGIDWVQILEVAKLRHPDIGVILTTNQSVIDMSKARKAMADAQVDYFLTKPINFDMLNGAIAQILEKQRLIAENRQLQVQLDAKFGLVGFTGYSPKMRELYKKISQIAPTETTVLIYGESGTGKELAARAIHSGSPRKDKFFVPIHCASFTESVLGSELFGHERGAFTGATKTKRGIFERADGGTLFLDEIGEINHAIQVKLLRVLETGEFQRVGGEETLHADVRIVAATNKNLEQAVKKGEYREDLFYRLNVVTVEMPPLRERKDDIPLLVKAFIDEFNEKHARSVEGVTPQAMRIFMRYGWSGNVRELKNCIEAMMVFTPHAILDVEDIPERILVSAASEINTPIFGCEANNSAVLPSSAPTLQLSGESSLEGLDISLGMSLEEVEREFIKETLKFANNNKAKAARILGISKSSIFRKIKEYKLSTTPTD